GNRIGADKAGVAVDEAGFIEVDRQQRTNVAHIFAIGDIVGQPMLAHKGSNEGKVAAEVAAGQKVLVTGIGGGCATFALMWARHHGAEVFVTSSSAEKIAAACELGAAAGFNYREDGWAKALRETSGGIDLVIDSAGGDGLHDALDTLSNGGRYVFFGATQGNASTGLNMAKLFFKQVRIQGTTMGRPEEFAAMVDFINAKQLRPVVDHVYPFAEAVAAHKRMQESEQMGKLVLEF
ncbi:MAG: zinc-binding dehydrogenase, partial [Gammaproteobacteria bacterium]